MFGNAFYLFAIIFACSVENIAQTYPRGRGHLFSLFAMVLGLLFFPPSIFSILSFLHYFLIFFIYYLSLSVPNSIFCIFFLLLLFFFYFTTSFLKLLLLLPLTFFTNFSFPPHTQTMAKGSSTGAKGKAAAPAPKSRLPCGRMRPAGVQTRQHFSKAEVAALVFFFLFSATSP